jgi:glycosyltransferase involved in cell wall biosynthesis
VNVAVLSLTRDRLAYTKHCFQTLADNAGCDYQHYVVDQGSTDGTEDWLLAQDELDVTVLGMNVGICPALNYLLEAIQDDEYDVVVKFDNDCELLTPNTLRDVCEATLKLDAILSPHIHGLRNTPPTLARLGKVSATHGIGGIFMAVPATVFTSGYRHDERNPPWGGDDHDLSAWFRARGGIVGYLDGYHANHYLTTDGQHADNPAYFARKDAEAAA